MEKELVGRRKDHKSTRTGPIKPGTIARWDRHTRQHARKKEVAGKVAVEKEVVVMVFIASAPAPARRAMTSTTPADDVVSPSQWHIPDSFTHDENASSNTVCELPKLRRSEPLV